MVSSTLTFCKKNSLAHIERCWLIGNGSSLKYTDINSLKDEITIGFNGIGAVFEPTYLCVINGNLLQSHNQQFIDSMKKLKNTIFVITDNFPQPEWMEKCYMVKRAKNPITLQERFNPDFEWTYKRGTTLGELGIPLANYLGIKTIYLVGVDATLCDGIDYHGLQSVEEERFANTKTEKEIAFFLDVTGKTLNHIQNLYNREGGKIYDCTFNPHKTIGWNFFEKRNYLEVLNGN